MIMIAPNCLALQKKGEGEEEVVDLRKRGQKGTPTSGANVPTGLPRSGVLDTRSKRKKWTVVWHCTLQDGQKELGISPILSR